MLTSRPQLWIDHQTVIFIPPISNIYCKHPRYGSHHFRLLRTKERKILVAKLKKYCDKTEKNLPITFKGILKQRNNATIKF